MQMPGRTFAASASTKFRYGFNGKELDNDIAQGDLDFGARIYDSRLGRFLTLDPMMKTYPSETPYIFAGNTPIGAVDVDGKYKIVVHLQYDAETKQFTLIRIEREEGLKAVPVMKQMYCGGCNKYYMGEDSYDWYDYMTFTVEVVNNKSDPLVIGVRDIIVGSPRTNTDVKREWWAKLKVSDGRSGIMWTTAEDGGTGAGVWGLPENVESENLDNLMQMQKGIVKASKALKLPKIVELVRKMTKLYDALFGENPPNSGTDENGKPVDHMVELQTFLDKILPPESSGNQNNTNKRPTPVKQTVVAPPSGVVKDPNSGKVTQFSKSKTEKIPAKNAKDPDTIRTTKFQTPKSSK
jgi:RHS repeat-associated protein